MSSHIDSFSSLTAIHVTLNGRLVDFTLFFSFIDNWWLDMIVLQEDSFVRIVKPASRVCFCAEGLKFC